MSIESMCSKDRIEIRREVVVRSSGGEATKTWTVGARGNLPALDVKCRIQSLGTTEVIMAGVSSSKNTYKLHFFFNPSIDKRDRIYLVDGGQNIELECQLPSGQHDNQNRLWDAVGIQFGPGKR